RQRDPVVSLPAVSREKTWPVGKIILVHASLHLTTLCVPPGVTGNRITARYRFADIRVFTPVHPRIAVHKFRQPGDFSYAVIAVIADGCAALDISTLLGGNKHDTVSAK